MKRELIEDILDPNYKFEFENDNYDYSDDYIYPICLNCGKTDKVHNFIYDKCSRKKYYFKINKKEVTLECDYCEKETLIPLNFFKD